MNKWPLILWVCCLLVVAPRAQCGENLVMHAPLPGTNSWVNAMVRWDPDGVGPRTPLVVLGGKFWTAGDVYSDLVARYDPATGAWGEMGINADGAFNGIAALAALPNGDLVAGGDFTVISSPGMSFLVRWDGTSWQPVGGGVNGPVRALFVRANGDLVVGGTFTTAGGVSCSNVAVWDGASWQSVPAVLDGPVNALAELPNGDLVAGGWFSTPSPRIARYDGSAWYAMGSGFTSGPNGVNALAVMPNGTLVAAGDMVFSGSSLVAYLARWTGTSWVPLDPGRSFNVLLSMQVRANGSLLVGGTGNAVAQGYSVGSWDGTSWTTYGPISWYDEARCVLDLPGGEILAGGYFHIAAGEPMENIRRWDGVSWRPLIAGTDAAINAATEMSNGDLVVGGDFTRLEGAAITRLAAWDGTSWRSLGAAPDGSVHQLATRPNGDLIAAGGFTSIGGIQTSSVARWDGTTWDSMSSPFVSWFSVGDLLACSNGDVIVAGDFLIQGGGPPYALARWNGTTWSGMGFNASYEVDALAETPNGDVIAGGHFSTVSGVTLNNVGRWDGTAWHPLGPGVFGRVLAVAVCPNGDIVAGGDFTTNGSVVAYDVARWDGTSWHGFATAGSPTEVKEIEVLPNGDLLVGGQFSPNNERGVKLWNGSSWNWVTRIHSGGGSPGLGTLVLKRNGTVVIAGNFDTVNLQGASASLVEWQPRCPALATDVGGGCAGTMLPLVLSATTLPWSGAAFSGSASGFGIGALAASVFGIVSPQATLMSWTQLAGPGCLLMASLDSVALVPVTAGAAHSALTIPSAAVFTGLDVYHQFVQLEPGNASAGASVSVSNGMRLRIGTY